MRKKYTDLMSCGLFYHVYNRGINGENLFKEARNYPFFHANPQRHGFVQDFRDYPHSSCQAHLSAQATRLNRADLLNWFDEKDNFLSFHQRDQILKDLALFEIEIDD